MIRKKRRMFLIFCAFFIFLILFLAFEVQALADWSQGFEDNVDGWVNVQGSDIYRVSNGYKDKLYASGINSAIDSWHARLTPGSKGSGSRTDFAGKICNRECYRTDLYIYLDVEYAKVNIDKRFDWVSSITKSDCNHLRDFAFNLGTTPLGFAVSASTNAGRDNSWPENPANFPRIISKSGWYLFRHTFIEKDNKLAVNLEIFEEGKTRIAAWTIYTSDVLSDVRGSLYGWFVNEEIDGLAIDHNIRERGNEFCQAPICIDNDNDKFFTDVICNIPQVPQDCNDNDASINPAALEFYGDKIDNNCNGLIDERTEEKRFALYYNFDANPQTHLGIVEDNSGNNNYGTFYTNEGATNKAVQGKKDSALSFDGVDDYVTIRKETNLIAGTNEFTVAGWINLKETNKIQNLLAWKEPSSPIQFMAATGDNKIGVWACDKMLMSIPYSYTTNTWYHVAFVRSGNTWKTYVNGNQVGSDVSDSCDLGNPTLNYYIGSEATTPSQFFNGVIDEFAIFNRGLSACEIKEVYEKGASYDALGESCPKIKLEGAKWLSMDSKEITKADLNDRVQLRVHGENFEGKEITFTIYKERLFWFDKKVSAQTSSVGWITWVANKSGEYYFEAVIKDGTKETSDNLVVSEKEDNKPPYVKILNPKQGEIFLINYEISFQMNIIDEDDFYNYTWDFGDGEKSNVGMPNHAYTTTGQKNILLEGEDERGLKNEDKTSILIIDKNKNEKWIFALISQPKHEEKISGNKVFFNATGSYAIETLNNEVKCIAGNCPNYVAPIQNPKANIIGTPNWEGFENLEFNWTFIEKDKKTYRTGKGNSGALFEKEFSTPATPEKPHKALLIINLENTRSRERETQFSMKFDKPVCYREGNDKSYWIEEYEFIDSKENCYKPNGSPPDCCPYELEKCNRNTGKCEEGAIECKQYSTPKDCGNFNSAVPEAELNPILKEKNRFCNQEIQYGTCWEKTSCICYWNEKCVADSSHTICNGNNCYNYTALPSDINKLCESEKPPVIGDCLWDFKTRNECNTTGKIYRTFNVVWTGKNENKPDYCEDGEDSMLCVSQVLLGFFDNLNLIIAIVIIVIFYIIIIRKKTKYKRKKRK